MRLPYIQNGSDMCDRVFFCVVWSQREEPISHSLKINCTCVVRWKTKTHHQIQTNNTASNPKTEKAQMNELLNKKRN